MSREGAWHPGGFYVPSLLSDALQASPLIVFSFQITALAWKSHLTG